MVLTFESADEILKCDHSNESHRPVRFCDQCSLLYYTRWYNIIILYKMVLTFEFVDEILDCAHSYESLTEQYVPVVQSVILCKVVLTLESVDKILKCDHSNESY